MRYQISEVIASTDLTYIMQVVESRVRSSTRQVQRIGENVVAKNVDSTFGSINNYTEATFAIRTNGSVSILTADVLYRPSGAFWIFLLITLFSAFGWIVPIGFYLYHKDRVRSAIENVMKNVKTECEFQNSSIPIRPLVPPPPKPAPGLG